MPTSGLDYLADFDSATAMLRALAAFLHCRDLPDLGLSSALRPLAIGTNLLPTPLRQEIYKLGGYFESVEPFVHESGAGRRTGVTIEDGLST
jgi:hypothetical protein